MSFDTLKDRAMSPRTVPGQFLLGLVVIGTFPIWIVPFVIYAIGNAISETNRFYR